MLLSTLLGLAINYVYSIHKRFVYQAISIFFQREKIANLVQHIYIENVEQLSNGTATMEQDKETHCS